MHIKDPFKQLKTQAKTITLRNINILLMFNTLNNLFLQYFKANNILVKIDESIIFYNSRLTNVIKLV